MISRHVLGCTCSLGALWQALRVARLRLGLHAAPAHGRPHIIACLLARYALRQGSWHAPAICLIALHVLAGAAVAAVPLIDALLLLVPLLLLLLLLVFHHGLVLLQQLLQGSLGLLLRALRLMHLLLLCLLLLL